LLDEGKKSSSRASRAHIRIVGLAVKGTFPIFLSIRSALVLWKEEKKKLCEAEEEIGCVKGLSL
jgi:hypothetical protein